MNVCAAIASCSRYPEPAHAGPQLQSPAAELLAAAAARRPANRCCCYTKQLKPARTFILRFFMFQSSYLHRGLDQSNLTPVAADVSLPRREQLSGNGPRLPRAATVGRPGAACWRAPSPCRRRHPIGVTHMFSLQRWKGSRGRERAALGRGRVPACAAPGPAQRTHRCS